MVVIGPAKASENACKSPASKRSEYGGMVYVGGIGRTVAIQTVRGE